MPADKKIDQPEAYPQSTQSDKQQQNQPEFIDEQPNDFKDKSISNLPANERSESQSNDPGRERMGN